MKSFRIIAVFVVSLSAAIVSTAAGQAPPAGSPATDTSKWETLRPEGEEFTVLMPKGSSFETSKEPYHKMELNTRTYLSQSPNGPVLAVVSLSGIKQNPAMYTETQRVNSYVDAFKKLFTPKLKKTAIPKLHFVRNKTLMGHTGREYSMAVGDLSGTVHAFATKKRFYALVYLNTKPDDPIQEQFLSSFVLPEKIVEAPPPPPVAENPPPTGEPSPDAKRVDPTDAGSQQAADNSPKTGPKRQPGGPVEPGSKRPIRGGLLNGKAITLPKPIYPSGAEVSGTVTVEVTIDEYGNVASARAVSGPPPLQQAAVDAARQARFSPTFLMGEAVKVTGVITYNFAR
jgi:TonB family protein